MGPDDTSAAIASFPLLCAWLNKFRPEISTEQTGRALEDKLKVIITNQLRRSGYFDKDDVTHCRNDIYMVLERKLSEPMEFRVDGVQCEPAERAQLGALKTEVIHLLRPEPFAILVRHADFEPSSNFCARLRDTKNGAEVVTISRIPCGQDQRVPIRLAYRALDHEQDAFVELSRDGDIAPPYCVRVKAVCHESFAVRMGFVVSTARNIVLNHCGKDFEDRNLTRLDDLPYWRQPGRRDDGQDVALLALKSAIKLLPRGLQTRLRQRYIEGLSWSEIAQLLGMSEAQVRKEDSRLMEKLAGAFVSSVPAAPKGALARVVRWLKEMMHQVLERE
jgi:hypothetical protein